MKTLKWKNEEFTAIARIGAGLCFVVGENDDRDYAVSLSRFRAMKHACADEIIIHEAVSRMETGKRICEKFYAKMQVAMA